MDFEKLRQELDETVSGEPVKKVALDLTRAVRHPVDGLRRRWKLEIIVHLVVLVLILTDIAFMSPLRELPNAVVLICLTIVMLMSLAWFLRTIRFIRKTSDFSMDTARAIDQFIWEAKLTLEVQIAYSIAGCSLLPIAFFALFTGDEFGEKIYGPDFFERVFLLKLHGFEWLWLIGGYATCMFALCYSCEWWFRRTYKRYVSPLEDISKSLREE